MHTNDATIAWLTFPAPSRKPASTAGTRRTPSEFVASRLPRRSAVQHPRLGPAAHSRQRTLLTRSSTGQVGQLFLFEGLTGLGLACPVEHDHGQRPTRARTGWNELPAIVRAAVESATGEVRGVEPISAGLNRGIAALLRTPTGRVFLKASPATTPRRPGRGVVVSTPCLSTTRSILRSASSAPTSSLSAPTPIRPAADRALVHHLLPIDR